MADPAESSKRAAPGTPFKKGQSGNPGGRKKGANTAAREAAGDDPKKLVEILMEIAQNPKERTSDRIACVKEILDRGWGKAPSYQPIEEDDPLGMKDQETRDAADRFAGEVVRLADRRTAKPAVAADGERASNNGHPAAG